MEMREFCTPTVGELVTFTASASGSQPIAFAWDWGDGLTDTGAMATHIFTPAAAYTVTLVASNGCGQQMVQDVITVVAAPPEEWRVYLPIVGKG
jgi:PKD repeat protein